MLKLRKMHSQLLEEEIIKPQLKRQVSWANSLTFQQTPWNKDLAYLNCSFDLNECGDEGEDLDKFSSLYKFRITVF